MDIRNHALALVQVQIEIFQETKKYARLRKQFFDRSCNKNIHRGEIIYHPRMHFWNSFCVFFRVNSFNQQIWFKFLRTPISMLTTFFYCKHLCFL